MDLLDISIDKHAIGLNYSVWDVQNNLIVKLVEGKLVAKAFRGFSEISLEEIHDVYGDPPVL